MSKKKIIRIIIIKNGKNNGKNNVNTYYVAIQMARRLSADFIKTTFSHGMRAYYAAAQRNLYIYIK